MTVRSKTCRTSGDVLRNFGGKGLAGLRGVYERLLKLGYGFSIMASVPLIMDNFQVHWRFEDKYARLSACIADGPAE